MDYEKKITNRFIRLMNQVKHMTNSQNTQEILKKAQEAILSCDAETVKAVVKEAIDAKIDPLQVIEEGLTPVLREMGVKFEKQEIYLPQLVMASEAMKAGMEILVPLIPLDQRSKSSLGKIVIGTVEGDIHNIGKSLVSTMLSISGFDIVDLGADVIIPRFVEEAERTNAKIIAASALMTTTMTRQKDIVEYLTSINKRQNYKLMVGGAPVTQKWADEIGAEGYGKDASEAAKVAKEII